VLPSFVYASDSTLVCKEGYHVLYNAMVFASVCSRSPLDATGFFNPKLREQKWLFTVFDMLHGT
jgi:hypothetical protein